MSNSPTPWSVDEVEIDIIDANGKSLNTKGWNQYLADIKLAVPCVNALAGIITEKYKADEFVKHVKCICNYLSRDKNTVMQNLNMQYALEQLTAALARKEAAGE